MCFRFAVQAVIVFSLLCFAPFSSLADSIVAPNSDAFAEGNSNNVFPFYPLGSMRYQQVYSASEFASLGGSLDITAINFRPDAIFGQPFSATLPDIQIDLSTTSVSPATLSTVFANNVGANDSEVFDGALSLSSSDTGPATGPKNFDIVINLMTPFLYDPADGNLLLDVRNFLGVPTPPFDADASSTAIQRVFSTDVNAPSGDLDDSNGLVTQFTGTVAPEPSSLLLICTGIAALAAAGVLKKRLFLSS